MRGGILVDILIIGGGASGLAAAIEAAKRGRVTVLEKAPRVGRKLAVTGNGRCNLTNLDLSPDRYHGEEPDFVRPALERFGVEETLRFFRGLGLVTVAEPSGRVYPHSDQAGSVVDVLRFAAGRAADLRCECPVTAVRREADGFKAVTALGEQRFDRLIIAAGGAAGTKAGGSLDGYRLLGSLGHTCTPLTPSLVQLRTDNAFTRPLKGVRADAGVELCMGGRVAARSAGEVQFTDYGLSGPAIFEVSRQAAREKGGVVRLDLLRRVGPEELEEMLLARRDSGLTAENLLTGILHNRLGRTVLLSLGFGLNAPVSGLSGDDVRRIVRAVKATEIRVTGDLGMEGAQVTAGGIRTAEFDPETMESRLVPGLFACGEVLDVDGDCGGYNLQWAFSSGRLAGCLGEKG